MYRTLLPMTLLVCLSVLVRAEEPLSPAGQLALIEAVRPALVHVEYTLQYDKGEAPRAAGWVERCPSCGRFHVAGQGEDLVRQQRPKELPGFLLAPARVLVPDLQIHPRFVKSIVVRVGKQLIPATVAAYLRRENAVILELAEAVRDVQPLEFKTGRPGPYYAITHNAGDGTWTTHVQTLPTGVTVTETGRQARTCPSGALIVDREGVPIGAAMNGELPLDESWQGSPLAWATYSAAEMAALLDRIRGVAQQALLHTTLKFRSPKKEDRPWRVRTDEEEGATEMQVVGVLRDATTLLVLANLKPSITARLEQIQVQLPDGTQRVARFEHTVREYGCFAAKLETPLEGSVRIDESDIHTLRNALAVAAEVMLYGESTEMRFLHARVPSFAFGYKRQVYPEFTQEQKNLFLFRDDGTLVAVPAKVREAVKEENDWDNEQPDLTPLAYLLAGAGDPATYVDASNVPLTEAQENRLAWLGVELQSLNAELARANNVAKLTQDGSFGALVSYVYPGSPAAAAGIEAGDVLLRLRVAGQPKPIPVRAGEDMYSSSFPWERLGEVPEEYFDQIPKPWPPAENTFTRTLTDLGFGKRYEAEVFRNNEVVSREFEVVESPPHYDSAERYKSDVLGLTVRNLTFEVRRYFQMAEDEPGVIVSKIEQGSRASVGGVKPYEIVTQVNDQPAKDVREFERLAKAADSELRLNVKRMTRNRVVKLNVAGGAASPGQPTSQPAGERAAEAP